MNGSHCPEKQQLADFTCGKLPEDEASSVSQHVAMCASCEATVQSLEAKSETLASGLRNAPPKEPYVDEPGYRQAVSELNKLPAGGKPKTPQQAEGRTPAADVTTPPSVAPHTAVSTPGNTPQKPAAKPAEKPVPKLGPYKLLAKLGEGGMGAVYKALHEHLGKTVAIKVLPKKAMQDQAAVARFRREMKAVGALHHPNIVGAHDAGEAQGVHYLVMEYVEGSDLSALVKKQGPLPTEKAISYIRQAACGLAFAHGKGVVHRDIKPANLLVDTEGTLKILDMGLARLDDGDPAAREGLTQTGQVMGTVDYMAPEQAFDTHTADGKADVYSLGCTLYRILTGQNMFTADTLVQKILAHREAAIPALGKVRPDAPPQLDALYQRMVAKKPEQRPTMAEVASELEALEKGARGQGSGVISGPALDVVIDTGTAESGKRKADAKNASPERKRRESSVPQPERQRREPAPSKSAPSKPPRSPNVKWIAAAAGAAALLFTGIWIIVRGSDGKEDSRTYIPDGKHVEIVSGGPNRVPTPVVKETVRTDMLPPKTVAAPSSSIGVADSPFHVLSSPDWQWTTPESLGPHVNSAGQDYSPTVSADGLTLIFSSFRGNGLGGSDLWMSRRPSADAAWEAPANLGTAVNGASNEHTPFLSTDGLTLLFMSNRPGGVGGDDLWQTTRRTTADAWSPAAHLGRAVNSTAGEDAPFLSPDGLTLWFCSDRAGGAGGYDIWMSRRATLKDTFGPAENLGPPINTPNHEADPSFSSDGRVLLYAWRPIASKPTEWDLKMATRSPSGTWTTPVSLPSVVNSTTADGGGEFLPDGHTMVFHSRRTGGVGQEDLWLTRRVPRTQSVSSPISDYALSFDDKSVVEIPSLKLDPAGPLTTEAYITPRELPELARHLIGVDKQFNLSINQGGHWGVSIAPTKDRKGVPVSTTKPVEVDRRAHVAGVWSGPTLQLFVNGKKAGSAPTENQPLPDPTKLFTLGSKFVGLIDEVRVSRSVRYTKDFTPPTRFEPDADTTALYHFDEGTGDVLTDASGNNYHGKIVGAKWVRSDGSAVSAPTDSTPSIAEMLTSPDYEWSEPVKVASMAKIPAVSGDGLSRAFVSSDGSKSDDIWMTERDSLDKPFRRAENLGPTVNSDASDYYPWLSVDGLTLIFGSGRPGGMGNNDLWMTTRPARGEPFGAPTPLGAPVNTSNQETAGALSADGRILVFASTRASAQGAGDSDIWQCRRAGPHAPFGDLQRLGPEVNSPLAENRPSLSPDGRVLIFATSDLSKDAQGRMTTVFGSQKMWFAVRPNLDAPFGPRQPLGPPVADSGLVRSSPSLSSDGKMLFFESRRVETDHELWMSRRVRQAATASPPPAVAPFDAAQARAHQEAWARHLGTTVETTNTVGAKMILIPPGEFLMGSNDEQIAAALRVADEAQADQATRDRIKTAERPQHRVVITKPFWMGATEVTVGQFKRFGASGFQTEAERAVDRPQAATYLSPGYAVTDDSPAAFITWDDAVAYCNWLSTQEQQKPCYRLEGTRWVVVPGQSGYRLPTEAEWEYACRAGSTSQYSFGDDQRQLGQHGWYQMNADRRPHAVGTRPPNGFGLFDLHGNVQEWCQDYWDEAWYASSPTDDPTGPVSRFNRVLRGGAWTANVSGCRAASRNNNVPSTRYGHYGFRVVRVLDAPATTASITPQSSVPAASSGKLFMHDPAFLPWVKDVRAMPAEKQVEAVTKKLVELNPGIDGKVMGKDSSGPPKIENGVVVEFGFLGDHVADISPLRAFVGLKALYCGGYSGTKNSKLSDLSPLQGLPLTSLNFSTTKVSDLTPLAGMPLNYLYCWNSAVSDLSPLEECKSLKTLNVTSTMVTAEQVASLQKALPNCKIVWDEPAKSTGKKLAYLDPAFQQWVAEIQKQPAEKQLEVVSKKLMELNPGFDGKLAGVELRPEPKIENGVVLELGFYCEAVSDLSPVRALSGLKKLGCWGRGPQRARYSDLSPLEGLQLDYLAITGSDVTDLTPLRGMPLATLFCAGSRVEDLSPLRGAPLSRLLCKGTRVTDLSPLSGMALVTFECNGLVADITPLAGMPLVTLMIEQTQVTDLSVLESCKELKSLKVSAKITAEQIAVMQKALPNCTIEKVAPKPAPSPTK